MSAPTPATLRGGGCDPYAETPYANSPEGWWTAFGGALDVRSGVVYIPPGKGLPPCPFPCATCHANGRQN
jgi:hypothetical protein